MRDPPLLSLPSCHPSQSILAEPPVPVVEGNLAANGTEKVAPAYLEILYSAEGQMLAAKHHYRPIARAHAPLVAPLDHDGVDG